MRSFRIRPVRHFRIHPIVKKKKTDSDCKELIYPLFINSLILSEPRTGREEGDGGITPGEHEEQR